MIVEAPYYAHIADELAKGAIAALDAAGASYQRFAVPGAFEIPAAIRFAVEARRERGEAALSTAMSRSAASSAARRRITTMSASESARGLQDLALDHGLAIGFGILTVENEAQALARAARRQEATRAARRRAPASR